MQSGRPDWDADQYANIARFVSDFGVELIKLLGPQPGEKILDLGCGDGELTLQLLARGAEVVGIDSSPDMVRAARARGVDALLMDAEQLEFEAEFDGAFSNATIHWIRHPELALEGVARALKPGGRFVGEFGGYGNIAQLIDALDKVLDTYGLRVTNPWYFPDRDQFAALLGESGFREISTQLFPRPTELPGRIEDWLQFFATDYLTAIPVGDRAAAIGQVVDLLAPTHQRAGVWVINYVRLRFSAIRS